MPMATAMMAHCKSSVLRRARRHRLNKSMERLRVESESSGATPWQDLTVRRLRIAARRASILGRRTV
jgi:hypothetical protein